MANDEIVIVNKKLDQVLETLSAIVRLLVPEARASELGLKGEQKLVYELCDSTRTIADIAKIIGKSTNQISTTLTRLKDKKLVSSMQKSGNAIYFRIHSIVETSDKS